MNPPSSTPAPKHLEHSSITKVKLHPITFPQNKIGQLKSLTSCYRHRKLLHPPPPPQPSVAHDRGQSRLGGMQHSLAKVTKQFTRMNLLPQPITPAPNPPEHSSITMVIFVTPNTSNLHPVLKSAHSLINLEFLKPRPTKHCRITSTTVRHTV